MRTLVGLSIALFLISGCTLAGDTLHPYEERRAECSFEDSTPIPQTGLVPAPIAQKEER
ncbi:hypothetical protein [Pelagibius sp. Alg239-R121]|uniref:hypothetical protein n=1 Tax=Pelagibius sp. Alg239-R121 TaxID=2993448 RepID=UPI0024A6D2F5|nr:hypothetical protein [Pelagibius sp. Alg239-R121]